MKEQKKKGLSRLFEIAGEKKGLLILAGFLSALSACCMLVPYLSVYQVLDELLKNAGKSPIPRLFRHHLILHKSHTINLSNLLALVSHKLHREFNKQVQNY